jgi:DNA-binding transcriptional ArsR family regulator
MAGPHEVVIDDVAALKALADPLRRQMLGLLEEPRTVKDLAASLGRKPDRLYYHLRQLERHGLVRVVDERAAERRFQAARSITIDPGLAIPPATVDSLVGSLLDDVRAELAATTRRERHDDVKRTMLAARHLRLTEAERAELTARLAEISREYDDRAAAAEQDDEHRTYGVLIGIWPVAESEEA